MDDTGARRRAGAGWRVAAAAAVAIAFAAPARAAESSNGFGEVRLGLMHFDYAEYENGMFLDGEKGWIPSVTGELELHRDRLFGRVMLRYASGSVDYNGQTQSGTPLQTQSDATFLQGEVQVGGFVDPAKRLALFGGLGARRWTRDIQGSGGYTEVYSWGELQAGLRWTFLQKPGDSWDVDARLVRTFNAAISIDLTKFGIQPGNPSLDLGAETGWRVGSTFRHDLGPNRLVLAVSAWVEGYSFGRSQEVLITDPSIPPPNNQFLLHEPDSKTTNFGLEVGIGGKF